MGQASRRPLEYAVLLLIVLGARPLQAAPPADLGAPTLALQSPDGQNTLRLTAGQPGNLVLNLPGETWTTANIGHFGIRLPGGQYNLQADFFARDVEPQWTFDEPGYALVMLAVGPRTAAGASDSWQRTTHCTKLILRVDPDPRGPRPRRPAAGNGAGLTDKVGHRIEILPLIAPPSLRPGADLPLRVYFESASQAGVEVRASAPDGTVQQQTSDAHGFVNFRMTTAGRWIVRFDKLHDGTPYRAELAFEVAARDGGRDRD